MQVEGAWLTDAGRYRAENEDALDVRVPSEPLLLQRKGCLYVIADGLGGHAAGEVASATAVETTVQEYYSPSSHTRIEPALKNAFQAANLRIHNLALHNSAYRSMETTLTAVALAGANAYVAHVGDSRLYHWRDGRLSLLTTDHSEAAELVRLRVLKPDKVRGHPSRSALTRTLGGRLIVRPDFFRQPLQNGDCFVLCTDGLWSALEDHEIGQVVGETDPSAACRTLVDMALDRDADDNLSVHVFRVVELGVEPDSGGSRNGWLSSIFQRGGPR
jgi:serine/threonine protein phosphatase PrpC